MKRFAVVEAGEISARVGYPYAILDRLDRSCERVCQTAGEALAVEAELNAAHALRMIDAENDALEAQHDRMVADAELASDAWHAWEESEGRLPGGI